MGEEPGDNIRRENREVTIGEDGPFWVRWWLCKGIFGPDLTQESLHIGREEQKI
jgi:hypothetical protein